MEGVRAKATDRPIRQSGWSAVSALSAPYSDLLFTLAVDVGVREGGPDCQIVSVGLVVLGWRLLAGRPPLAAMIVGSPGGHLRGLGKKMELAAGVVVIDLQ